MTKCNELNGVRVWFMWG